MITLIFISIAAMLWLILITLNSDLVSQNSILTSSLYYMASGLGTLAGVRILNNLLSRILKHTSLHWGTATSDLLLSVLAIILYLVAGMFYSGLVLNLNISSILTTSAMLSVIIGLAMQPTLGNLFSGVSLELERRLRVGDFLRHDNIEGEIMSMNWRSIHMKTRRGSFLIVPNSTLTSRSIEVMPQGQPYMHQINFNLSSSIPPDQVRRIAMQVINSGLPRVVLSPSPSIAIIDNDPVKGTLRYRANLYTLHLNRGTITSAFFERLWYALSRENIAFPKPNTLHPSWPYAASDSLLALAFPATGELAQNKIEVSATDLATVFAGISHSLRESLIQTGKQLCYAAQECCDTSVVSLILAGTVREAIKLNPAQAQQRLAVLLNEFANAITFDYPTTTKMRMQETEYQAMLNQASVAVGPLASKLCKHVASLTEDTNLAYQTIAQHIPTDEAKATFLATAPAGPFYPPLSTGAWLGWRYVVGSEAQPTTATVASSCRLVAWSTVELANCLRQASDADLVALATLWNKSACGCEPITAKQVRAWANA